MQSKENIYVFLLDIITDGLTFSGENPMNPVGFAVCVYPISGSLGVCVGVGGVGGRRDHAILLCGPPVGLMY